MTYPFYRKRGRSRGFSLMELLAVMSIMALLTTLAVTSYFGAVRGMARRSAVKHFANTLILARQRACMENVRISVVVFNELIGEKDTNLSPADVTPSYVVCKMLGRLSLVDEQNGVKNLVDEFTELDRLFDLKDDKLSYNYRGSVRLYNLNQGKWSNVYPWVEQYPFKAPPNDRGLKDRYTASGNTSLTPTEKGNGYTLNAFAFGINKTSGNLNSADDTWRVGDAYGIEVAPANSLPRNFLFTELGTHVDKAITITFTPDGRLATPADGVKEIRTVIEETIPQANNTYKSLQTSMVTVKQTGKIDFNGEWN